MIDRENNCKSCEIKFRYYMLQPGDATRYEIGIAPLPASASGVVRGTGNEKTTQEYVMILVSMPSGSGVTIVSKTALKHDVDTGHLLGYAMSHGFADVHEWTACAALLAASVLTFDPDDINGACEAMLKTVEVLAQ